MNLTPHSESPAEQALAQMRRLLTCAGRIESFATAEWYVANAARQLERAIELGGQA